MLRQQKSVVIVATFERADRKIDDAADFQKLTSTSRRLQFVDYVHTGAVRHEHLIRIFR
jgi:hypothetical protein